MNIKFVTCTFIFAFAIGFTSYGQLFESRAIGLEVGQLTGINLQLMNGHACGGSKDDFTKYNALDLTIGVDRLFNMNHTYTGKNLSVKGGGIRAQLSYQHSLLEFPKFSFGAGMGIQGGMREYIDDLTWTNSFSLGVVPHTVAEYFFLRTGTGRNPIYYSFFGKFSYYQEINPGFSDVHLAAGLRINFYQ